MKRTRNLSHLRYIRFAAVAAVVAYLLFREGDRPEWLEGSNATLLLAFIAVAAITSWACRAQRLHFSLRAHRTLKYVLIFPLLVIIPVAVYLGQGQIAAAIFGTVIAVYVVLFYAVGAACPKCGASLTYIHNRPVLFAPARRASYQCHECDFVHDRYDTEDPPF